jgi:hypothetical protein
MWRRMHTKEYFDYQNNPFANAPQIDETRPFLQNSNAANNSSVIVRPTTASRHLNESPSFQRLVINSSSINSNNTETANTISRLNQNTSSNNGILTLNRNRFNTLNQRSNPFPSINPIAPTANMNATLKFNNHNMRANELNSNTDSFFLLNMNNSYAHQQTTPLYKTNNNYDVGNVQHQQKKEYKNNFSNKSNNTNLLQANSIK